MKTVSPARPGLTLLRCLNERLSHVSRDRVGLANPVGSLRHDFRLRDIRFQQFLHLGGILSLAAQTHHLHGSHSPWTIAQYVEQLLYPSSSIKRPTSEQIKVVDVRRSKRLQPTTQHK